MLARESEETGGLESLVGTPRERKKFQCRKMLLSSLSHSRQSA